jgi:hypothetical protein
VIRPVAVNSPTHKVPYLGSDPSVYDRQQRALRKYINGPATRLDWPWPRGVSQMLQHISR